MILLPLLLQRFVMGSPFRRRYIAALNKAFLKALTQAFESGVTERDIADELGISRPTVSRWRQGLSTPHPYGQVPAIKSFRKLIQARR